ncbi:RNA-dependent RNA polymerase [Aspergillus fumigatus polymycovirus 1]|uniref:RNA-dependent RNA polymerase n=1 Tax=Aspergillus fumigatus polymycovirus 1 TaxID=2250469 RepID=A0A7I8CX89_9VIRU|nr:RNA-dependent RNA polymerase [Aspergillus fumigatus polymycovirus 1]
MSSNLDIGVPETLKLVVGGAPSTASAPTASYVSDIVSWYARRSLKGGLLQVNHTMSFVVGPGPAPVSVPVHGVATGSDPVVAAPQARARAFRLKSYADGDLLRELRQFDGAKNASELGPRAFVRDSHRLDAAVEKASKLKDPTFHISQYQLPHPYSFGGGPPNPERPLTAPLISAVNKISQRTRDPVGYRTRAKESIDLGDFTTHDPDTLHPRFLEYVHERTRDVDGPTDSAMRAAQTVLAQLWRRRGCKVKARNLSDAHPDNLLAIIKKGSPGEYRSLGAEDRRDPRLIATMSSSLLRYASAGVQVARGRPPPGWVDTTTQVTLTFGKREPKAAKIVDGVRQAPVPRFIFNLSPVNYALASFLHYDISHFLMDNDPTHGPGFGPGRGRARKFMDLVERAFDGRFSTPDGARLIMSDITKWDANMCEALIKYSIDLLEDAVDKSALSPEGLATRGLMYRVARRQLLEKLVEHPAGYFVKLYGCMPSGSFYTSLVNTTGNNLLVIGHAIARAVEETSLTHHGAVELLADAVDGTLISYGDNQLFSEHLFSVLGLTYDPEKHAEFLARFGMKLKVDETEVTTKLGRVRFCSRSLVRTPHGLLVTRSHNSLFAKLAGRPRHDPVVDKLYVRAMMVDHMGTDPIVYAILNEIDRSLNVSLEAAGLTDAAKKVLEDTAQSMFGNRGQEALLAVYRALSDTVIDRRALLSLHTPRDGDHDPGRLHTSVSTGMHLFTGELTPAAQWAYECTVEKWCQYLHDTDQEGVMFD